MKKYFKLIVLLSVLVVLTAIATSIQLKNPDSIDISYYFGFSQSVPLYILLFGPFLIGLITGALLMSVSVVKNKMKTRSEHNKLIKVEKEVENLRAMPLKDEV